MSKFEKIQRNSYTTLGKLMSLTGQDFDWDYKNYHDARSQLHEQAEHGWGVAAGLEVEPVQPDQMQVRPGVAIDGEGKLIALSDDDIPPQGNLGWKVTKDFKGSLAYVTIGYGTDIKKNKSTTNKQLDLQVFEPAVSLVAPEDLKDPTKQLVLAIVELNEDRTIKGLAPSHPECPFARKLVGVPAGEIRLRRSELTTKDGQPPTVGDTVAVTLRPTERGVEIVGATETFRLDVTQTGTQKLAGMTFGATYVKFDQDILTDKKIDGRRVSEDGDKLDAHVTDKKNPHGITLEQLGPLSKDGETLKVTADIKTDKRIDGRDVSEDGKKLDEHLANKQNPHAVTLNQLGPLSADGKTLKVTDTLQAGDIKWGSNSSLLRNDQGGSIELGGNDDTKGIGTPYIDFHYKNLKEDYNARIINNADGKLTIDAKAKGGLTVNGPILMNGLLLPINQYDPKDAEATKKKVLAEVKKILAPNPVGTFVLFHFGSDGEEDPNIAWKNIKDKIYWGPLYRVSGATKELN